MESSVDPCRPVAHRWLDRRRVLQCATLAVLLPHLGKAQAQVALSSAINRAARFRALSPRCAKAYAQIHLGVLPEDARYILGTSQRLMQVGIDELRGPRCQSPTEHLERAAYLYVRQSAMKQVIENVESSKRQYALRARATALGWADDRFVVIDSDQGESGASASWREGFQRLVSDVGLGRAGIVMGLEVSRLARNNADWHRLLGLKGTMSEAELHVLKARLRGGILNKVRRGEYRCPLPTGFVYDSAGDVVLDPDSQIRESIEYFFDTFSRVGSAFQVVKVFRDGDHL